MRTIEVDFNSRDDAGHIPALIDEPVAVGELVDMFDDEGNRCLGRVAGFHGGSVAIRADWAAFAAETESRFVVTTDRREDGQPALYAPTFASPLTISLAPSRRMSQGPNDTDRADASPRFVNSGPRSLLTPG